MFDGPFARALIVTAIFVLAGIVKGVTGMGLPTVAMGLLGALMPPVSAAALLLAPSFVTNAWQMCAGPRLLPIARRFWSLLLGIVAGTLAAASFLTRGPARATTIALGSVLVIYAGIGLLARRPALPRRVERYASPAVGVATGAIAGATGIFVMPSVPYLQALDLEPDDLVQALGLSFMVSTIALAIGLAGSGALGVDGLSVSLLTTIPALLGVWIGQRIRARVSPAMFRRWFLIGLFALGLELMRR